MGAGDIMQAAPLSAEIYEALNKKPAP